MKIQLLMASLLWFTVEAAALENVMPWENDRYIYREDASSHPDIDRLLLALSGSWKIQVTFAPNEQMPKGGTGTGEETWRAGPGGLSVIEEYHSTGPECGVSGLGVFWPDKQRPTMRALWCDSTTPSGCARVKGGAK